MNQFNHLVDNRHVGFFQRALEQFTGGGARLSVGIHYPRLKILIDAGNRGRVALVVVDKVIKIVALLLRGESVAELHELNLRERLTGIQVADDFPAIEFGIKSQLGAGHVNHSRTRYRHGRVFDVCGNANRVAGRVEKIVAANVLQISLTVFEKCSVARVANTVGSVEREEAVADNRQVVSVARRFNRALLIVHGNLVDVIAQAEPPDAGTIERVGVEAFELSDVLLGGAQLRQRVERRAVHAEHSSVVKIVDALNQHVVKFFVNGDVFLIAGRVGVGQVVSDNVRAFQFAYHAGRRSVKSAPHSLTTSSVKF